MNLKELLLQKQQQIKPIEKEEKKKSELSLYLYIRLRLLSKTVFYDYKCLAEELGCYEYVKPAERTMYPPLLPLILEYCPTPKTFSDFYSLYFHIDTNFTEEDQKRLTEILLELKNREACTNFEKLLNY